MWPVIRRPGAPRTAPHRRYSPAPRRARPRRPTAAPAGLLYAGEPETCRRDLRQFLPILAHLGLLLAVFKVYRVEGRAFQTLVALALAALPVHYLLPYRWKKPLLRGGLDRRAGLGLRRRRRRRSSLALAAVLIGVCYLPIAWSARAAVVAALGRGPGAACAPSRSPTGIPDDVWPVLATMFMFRMILYLYELKHAKQPEPLVDTLELLLPAAELLLPPLPGGRLPDPPARLLRARHPRDPAGRACG